MQVSTEQIFLLCMAAFAAGFVDAIVGGGGLIQTPVDFAEIILCSDCNQLYKNSIFQRNLVCRFSIFKESKD